MYIATSGDSGQLQNLLCNLWWESERWKTVLELSLLYVRDRNNIFPECTVNFCRMDIFYKKLDMNYSIKVGKNNTFPFTLLC